LNHLNAYLIAGRSGFALVDTGLGLSLCQRSLEEHLAALGLTPRHIGQLFITHFHGDHWGLARWLKEQGALILMSRIDSDFLQRWFTHPEMDEAALHQYALMGLPSSALEQSRAALGKMRSSLPTFVPDRLVEDTEELELAGEPFQVILTPGHSPGHACLHHRPSRTLLVGDHVLPHITPNISVDYGSTRDPLSAYRSSLKKMRGQGYAIAWPAHGEAMIDLDARIEQILQHHLEREDLLLTLIDEGHRSCYSLCDGLFHLSSLDGWETWMALGETLAHLRALQTSGRVLEETHQGQLVFRRAPNHSTDG
jgi:glyoxylase-like metal-dependent hydrolase (beta-lactamase superfamily II)